MKEGLGKEIGEGYNVISIFEKRLKPNTIITTPKSDVSYALEFADLGETGLLVLQNPIDRKVVPDLSGAESAQTETSHEFWTYPDNSCGSDWEENKQKRIHS
ncbi:hypothetical protein V6x_20650 [Gimesia chilikensis]|uniref:Uncharacterized protein n=1 Tax=Gimesia chilikensis TaxID=2605989 RepID=A0A517WAR9_9PLAN|nr:hypothetical protein V6x_20650 [Gimesia chilikensis]